MHFILWITFIFEVASKGTASTASNTLSTGSSSILLRRRAVPQKVVQSTENAARPGQAMIPPAPAKTLPKQNQLKPKGTSSTKTDLSCTSGRLQRRGACLGKPSARSRDSNQRPTTQQPLRTSAGGSSTPRSQSAVSGASNELTPSTSSSRQNSPPRSISSGRQNSPSRSTSSSRQNSPSRSTSSSSQNSLSRSTSSSSQNSLSRPSRMPSHSSISSVDMPSPRSRDPIGVYKKQRIEHRMTPGTKWFPSLAKYPAQVHASFKGPVLLQSESLGGPLSSWETQRGQQAQMVFAAKKKLRVFVSNEVSHAHLEHVGEHQVEAVGAAVHMSNSPWATRARGDHKALSRTWPENGNKSPTMSAVTGDGRTLRMNKHSDVSLNSLSQVKKSPPWDPRSITSHASLFVNAAGPQMNAFSAHAKKPRRGAEALTKGRGVWSD